MMNIQLYTVMVLLMCAVLFSSLTHSSTEETIQKKLLESFEDFTAGPQLLKDSVTKETVQRWLEHSNEVSRVWNERLNSAQWRYETNISQENSNQLISVSIQSDAWFRKQAKFSRLLLDHFPFDDLDMKRQLRLKSVTAVPESDAIIRKQKVFQQQMSRTYSKSKLCAARKCLSLEPDLIKMMSVSRDPRQLLWAWKGWRDVIGPSTRDLLTNYVHLLNIGATDNGFSDIGEYQREKYYEFPQWIEVLSDQLLREIKPLYVELHTYVRHKLSQFYGPAVMKESVSTIPAHLLGDMWAQAWGNIFPIVRPFPSNTKEDFDTIINNQSLTPTELQQKAEQFYESIGLNPMMPKFWRNSIFKNQLTEMDCHPKAFDFHRKRDFRVKMCTNDMATTYDWNVAHHEMGHLEYYMAYRNQPDIYRNPANPAVDEAVGDTLAMFSSTHKRHIYRLSQGGSDKHNYKRNINLLMREALDKIPTMIFAYLLEKWRWRVYQGDISSANYTQAWWKMRYDYQGIHPPLQRTESDFDPGSKYHVLADIPYIRYFFSTVLQYQIHEKLCQITGRNIPIQHCDIAGTKEVGAKLLDFMELGSSFSWPQSLKRLTGTATISSRPILNYFYPLYTWLKNINDRQSNDLKQEKKSV
ncbi:angiotensin-converting enzyme [Octopus bimaculoides]|uniref:Angiotensin-converting enzyme n=1 Tax=Octopus bimaculoides TaxID=37653 RepID=A0A0L8HWW2_OCTBM|nr:angiotensin-converting enzyme [Octopus bimaculoides]|eukprot:XP_014768719.1 PREDICTED: angiotensin-converting enzyme-like [Octopus bimaculoides]